VTKVVRTMTPDEERAWTAGGYVIAARGLGEVPPAERDRHRRPDVELGCAWSWLCAQPPVAGSDLCARHLAQSGRRL
jgi:hypothetical protein